MGPMKLHFDIRDIFRAPRLALSGKKIWIFIVGNIVGYVSYWILTYVAFALAGINFSQAWSDYGLYPCLFGNEASCFAWIVYLAGVVIWFFTVSLSCTAVARVTYKQLKGDEFFSSGDACAFVKKHWHPVIFSSISLFLIIVFFLIGAMTFALFGKIPYVGEFLFVIPYLFYFFGAVFTIYSAIVFFIALTYTPAIVATCEEDTMGAVFQNYSIAWSQPWRVILYHMALLPIGYVGIWIFKYFWLGAFKLINCVYGCSWFMGTKLANIVAYASNIICPESVCRLSSSFCSFGSGLSCCVGNVSSCCAISTNVDLASISGTETIAGVILAIFLFLLVLAVISYGLSILSVGETIMFVIFKKKSDDDNLLERKDEDELEEEEEFETDETPDREDSKDSDSEETETDEEKPDED